MLKQDPTHTFFLISCYCPFGHGVLSLTICFSFYLQCLIFLPFVFQKMYFKFFLNYINNLFLKENQIQYKTYVPLPEIPIKTTLVYVLDICYVFTYREACISYMHGTRYTVHVVAFSMCWLLLPTLPCPARSSSFFKKALRALSILSCFYFELPLHSLNLFFPLDNPFYLLSKCCP